MTATVTDRALRYRAVNLIPDHPKVCAFCGATQRQTPMLVGHVDGREENLEIDNLTWTCRSCNSVASNTLQNAGMGRRTRQFNPTKSGGAANIGEWMQAVGAITPHVDRGDRGLASSMSVSEAVAMIRATPHSKRSEFASKLRHNPASRQNLFGIGSGKRKEEKGDYYVEGIGSFPTLTRARAAAQKEANEIGRRVEVRWKKGFTQHQSFVMPSKAVQKRIDRETKPQKIATYRGYKIERAPDGDYYSSLDSSSRFSTLKDVRKHIDWYVEGRGNPSKFDRCVKDVKKRGGAANAYAVCTAAGTRKKRRGNPAAASEKVYEEFHGRPSDETVTVQREVHFHKHLVGLGELRKLVIWGVDKQVHSITGFKGALLCTNEKKNQLFIEGGDQSINLEDFGIKSPHEKERLGKVMSVDYFTTKDHLGAEGGEAVYTHEFATTNKNGKHVKVDGARLPDLDYRVRDEQLEFSGGSYYVRAEGIDK